MSCAPHLGWRHVQVAEQRTGVDWALAIRELVDVHFAEAEQIVLVLDNLNTHRLSSLYAAFPAPEARRIARKMELHFTPRHGSWLNMAELEVYAPGQQCLNRRISDRQTLKYAVRAWVNGAEHRSRHGELAVFGRRCPPGAPRGVSHSDMCQ